MVRQQANFTFEVELLNDLPFAIRVALRSSKELEITVVSI